MKIELVIFDCDGVLVDSEHISSHVFAEILADHDVHIEPQLVFAKLRGGSMADAVEYIENNIGRKPDFDIEKEYRKRSFEKFRTDIKPIEGIEEVLQKLQVPFCVGSNGPSNKIRLNLEVTGLIKYFDEGSIFSAYDDNIKKWKPHPKLFITAAHTLGCNPESCVVIEDSGHGAEAAQHAGMKCYGYARDTDESIFRKYGATPINHMKELLAHLPIHR